MYKVFEEYIKRKGLTIYKVAKDIGISSMCLYDWKNGKSHPKYDKMLKISTYLDVPITELMGEMNV